MEAKMIEQLGIQNRNNYGNATVKSTPKPIQKIVQAQPANKTQELPAV